MGIRDQGSGCGLRGQSDLPTRLDSKQQPPIPDPRSLIPILLLSLLISCTRSIKEPSAAPAAPPSARPMAVLQPGGHPLWFQLTEEGPVLLDSIEDALFSAAFVPWPLALHICFFQERGGALIMVINRDGFIKLAPYSGAATGIGLYRFSGGEFWRQYTAGGFVFFNDEPAALLYLDDRFLDSTAPLPQPRTWTFNMESNTPFPLNIPALDFFPVEDGWDADALRYGSDGFWYYRVSKRNAPHPEVRLLRTADLSQAGEDASQNDFQNSLPQKPELSEHPSLPLLPEGFFYTGTGVIGDSLFACWEEQEDYNIGAAGFLIMRN